MAADVGALTDKQTEVLAHLARGLKRAQIAREMQVSARTVRDHLREGIFRLGAVNGTHAVARAIGLGILPTNVATLQGASNALVR